MSPRSLPPCGGGLGRGVATGAYASGYPPPCPSPQGGRERWSRPRTARGEPMPVIADTLDDALAGITDGIMLAVPREVAGVPMEATRALIRRGTKRLHLVALPTASLQADLLIGAGAIATLETSAGSLAEPG